MGQSGKFDQLHFLGKVSLHIIDNTPDHRWRQSPASRLRGNGA